MKPDRVLNWAENRTMYVPVAGFTTGSGIVQLTESHWYGWLLLATGLILTAIRPVGTGLRRHVLNRQMRQALDEARKREDSQW